jgi:hypothetical protein
MAMAESDPFFNTSDLFFDTSDLHPVAATIKTVRKSRIQCNDLIESK